jgi:hypothetical protein
MNNKLRLERWGRKMMQFQRETREGLGAFGVSVIRAEDVSSLAQSKDRDAIAFTSAVIKWQAMIEGGTWQLCLACDYKFRSAKIARAFVFIQPICEEPTTVMLVGICEECSKKDDEELLEIAYQGCREMGLATKKMEVGRA